MVGLVGIEPATLVGAVGFKPTLILVRSETDYSVAEAPIIKFPMAIRTQLNVVFFGINFS